MGHQAIGGIGEQEELLVGEGGGGMAHRRNRGRVEGECWSGGAEEGR
jgi:hypothetical protein